MKITGKKVKMTQIFDDAGVVHPATVVAVSGDFELTEGAKVQISGTSKGKGFAGVVKRHGFHGGPRTHGQKHSEREPGSIGVGGVQRVLKGTRMAGRMGGVRVTVKNLKVLSVDKETGEVLISGAIPGPRGSKIEINGN